MSGIQFAHIEGYGRKGGIDHKTGERVKNISEVSAEAEESQRVLSPRSKSAASNIAFRSNAVCCCERIRGMGSTSQRCCGT